MVLASLLSATFAAICSTVVCLSADRLGSRLCVLDRPDGRRKLHAKATPLVGGLAIFAPTLMIAVGLSAFTEFLPLYAAVAFAGIGSLAMGYVDDRGHVRPTYRLLLAFAIAALALIAVPGVQVSFLNFTFSREAWFLGGFALPFSTICLVGLLNAVNMADGKNGVVGGLALAWSLELAIFAPPHLQPLLAAFAAATAVFLFFNLQGRLFLGDSGTYAISFVVALLALYVYSVGFDRLPADLVALWFLIPVVDCLRVMGRRIVRGVSPFSSDRNHLHHILYGRMPWRIGLTAFHAVVTLPPLLASFWPQTTALWAVAALTLYGVILTLPARLQIGASAR